MGLNNLRKQMINTVKQDIKEEYTETDLHITKTINLIDALDETINLLTEHLREWHAIHFPELNQLVKSNEDFIKLVNYLTRRKEFTEKNVSKIIKDKKLAKKISLKATNSSGQDTDPNTLNEIKKLSEKITELKKERKDLTKFVEKEMKEKWPRFSNVCGAILGARMLAKIGNGKKLAFAPSSTIQIIGAEKALFEALKKGGKTPKHGYLYAHPLIVKAKKFEKGKTARKLAGKISIAIKQDYFSKTQKTIQKPKTKEKNKQKFKKNNKKTTITQKGINKKNDFKEKRKQRFENLKNKFKRKQKTGKNKSKQENKFKKKTKFKKNKTKQKFKKIKNTTKNKHYFY